MIDLRICVDRGEDTGMGFLEQTSLFNSIQNVFCWIYSFKMSDTEAEAFQKTIMTTAEREQQRDRRTKVLLFFLVIIS